jgi:GT2 family glycosyltransferase
MYSDETDFCRRIKTQGWEVRHLPLMTIIHHEGKAGVKPHIEALGAYTRVMYARKYFSPPHRWAYAAAVMLRSLVRSAYSGRGETAALKRKANRQVVKTLLGRAPIPFGPPSRFSVRTGSPELRAARRRASLQDK